MHELALHGQVPKHEHHRLLQQLAGFTRMQPQDFKEIHIILKTRQPPGLDLVQSIGASNLVSQQQQDMQRVKVMLNTGLYYAKLIGEVQAETASQAVPNGDTAVEGINLESMQNNKRIRWTFEFKDTPEAGKQPVTFRLFSRIPMEGAHLMRFVAEFGYDYVSRYMITGSRFYDNNTTLVVSKLLRLPEVDAEHAVSDVAFLSNMNDWAEIDTGGGCIIEVSIDVIDGNNAQLKERATRELLGIKEALKQAVDLTPGDRLALDTKIPSTARRI